MPIRKVINAYNDNKIKSFKTVFNITNENDLNDFWFYFEESAIYRETRVSNYAEEIFHISSYIISGREHIECKDSCTFDIIFEKSDDFAYFTIWNRVIKDIFLKNRKTESMNYKDEDEKISFKIELSEDTKELIEAFYKQKSFGYVSQKIELEKNQKEIKELENKTKVVEKDKEIKESCDINRDIDIHSVDVPKVNQKKVVFDFIEGKDLTALYDSLDDLSEIFIENENKVISEDIIVRTNHDLAEFLTTLSFYEELYVVYNLIIGLNNFLLTHQDDIIESNINIYPLFEALITDLTKWLDSLFKFGTTSIDFLDASIKANIDTIESFVLSKNKTDKEVEEDIDDIFDF